MVHVWTHIKSFWTLPGDTPKQSLHKAVVSFFFAALGIAGLVTIVNWARGANSVTSFVDVAIAISTVFAIPVFAWMLATRRFPRHATIATMWLMLLGFLLSDLENLITRQAKNQAWPAVVVLIDLALLLELPDKLTLSIGGAVGVWVVVLALEEEYRLGMTDIVTAEKAEQCLDPPCPRGLAAQLRTILYILFIFFSDMIMTRSFAWGLRDEKAKIEASVELAGEIATALTKFDLGQASYYLANSDGLPDDLVKAFQRLIANLSTYRPYLPDSCFNQDDDAVSSLSESQNSMQDSGNEAGTESHSTAPCSVAGPSPVSLQNKMVSVVAVAGEVPKADQNFTSFQREWVTGCLHSIHTFRGILDDLRGDKLVAAFNGSKPCTSHAANSLRCAAQLREAVGVRSMGVATGRALCGDVGNDEVRRYCIVGAVMGQAHMLGGVAEVWGLTAVSHGRTFHDSMGSVVGRLLPLRVAFTEAPSQPVPLFDVVKEAACEEEEWMYQLSAMQESNPFAAVNGLVNALHHEPGLLRETVEKLRELGEKAESTLAVVERYHRQGKGLPVVQVVGWVGPFPLVDTLPSPLRALQEDQGTAHPHHISTISTNTVQAPTSHKRTRRSERKTPQH